MRINGTTTHEGRVEVYHQDQWGTICDDGWSIEDANVICLQLGYPSASAAHRNAHFGAGSGLIFLSDVACNGTESSIDLCDHNGWLNNNCNHNMDVGVTCNFLNPSSGKPSLNIPLGGQELIFEKLRGCNNYTYCVNLFFQFQCAL